MGLCIIENGPLFCLFAATPQSLRHIGSMTASPSFRSCVAALARGRIPPLASVSSCAHCCTLGIAAVTFTSAACRPQPTHRAPSPAPATRLHSQSGGCDLVQKRPACVLRIRSGKHREQAKGAFPSENLHNPKGRHHRPSANGFICHRTADGATCVISPVIAPWRSGDYQTMPSLHVTRACNAVTLVRSAPVHRPSAGRTG